MNFLLLERHEVDATGLATLRGRRAEHVQQVLRLQVGGSLRAAMVDGPLGSAALLAQGPDEVTVQVSWHEPGPAAAVDDVLLLAVPRPKVLLRMLAHATALGFSRIVLFRSWRVDKSHLQSLAMREDHQRAQLLAGLEQSGRTRVPTVQFFPLFKPMVEDELAGLRLPATRVVAHPAAAARTAQLALAAHAPFALAIGPDGGLLPYELDALAAQGFLAVSCGAHALRTETALAVLAGQLALLRERASFVP